MIIAVECIHRAKDSPKSIISDTLCEDNWVVDCNKVTCRIHSAISEPGFRFPDSSILLNDVMNFSNKMVTGQQYDCVLEITSFTQVDLFTDHRYSVRGKYWRCVPMKYLPKYHMYKEQECIEIGNDILLISLYNNRLTNKVDDGVIVEIIAKCELNLICAKI